MNIQRLRVFVTCDEHQRLRHLYKLEVTLRLSSSDVMA